MDACKLMGLTVFIPSQEPTRLKGYGRGIQLQINLKTHDVLCLKDIAVTLFS